MNSDQYSQDSAIPLVSVIIPTYKHGDLVLFTLQSVFSQTFSDFEVIVINDGSPDSTAEILRPLADANRICYFEQTNQGQAVARNRGLNIARGEFIAFLDDDDIWPPDKLEWQIDFLKENPDFSAVGGSADLVDVNGVFVGKHHLKSHEVNYSTLFKGCPFMSPGQTLIRASILKEVGGWRIDAWGTDDYDLLFRIAANSRIAYISRVSLLYRLHQSNASRNTEKMLVNTIKVFESHIHESPRRMRKRYRRSGYRSVYEWIGKKLLWEIGVSFKKRDVESTIRLAKLTFVFMRASLTDQRLSLWLIRDCCPVKLRRLVTQARSLIIRGN